MDQICLLWDFFVYYSMETFNFWKRVKALLKIHKISQAKFAEYINIPVSTFYSWIRHSRSPEIMTAYNIAMALGVPLEYLITGEDGKGVKIHLEQTETRKSATTRMIKLFGELQEEIKKI